MQFNKFEEYSRKALSTVYSEPETQFHNTLIPKVVEQFFVPLKDRKSTRLNSSH